MTNEVRYQCPLCRRQVTLSSIGIHYHKKHPWAKIIPRLETLKPVVASLPQIKTQPKHKRSIELKRMHESAVNQPYTKEDLKNDNINYGKPTDIQTPFCSFCESFLYMIFCSSVLLILLCSKFLLHLHTISPSSFSIKKKNLQHLRIVFAHLGNIMILVFFTMRKLHLFSYSFNTITTIMMIS
jgi:hypothetical protein